MVQMGFDDRSFPHGMAGHPCPTVRVTSLSIQGEAVDIGKGMISARASYQGVRSSVRDPETFAPRAETRPRAHRLQGAAG